MILYHMDRNGCIGSYRTCETTDTVFIADKAVALIVN